MKMLTVSGFTVSVLALSLLLGATTDVVRPARAAQTPRASGVAFEENRGQGPDGARFLARGAGGALAFWDGAVQVFHGQTGAADALRLEFAGAKAAVRPVGQDARPTRVTYLRGAEASRWARSARTFGAVAYESLYPGVDVRFHAGRGALEYDVLVAPGADPRAFALRIQGARRVTLDAQGRLVAETAAGTFVQEAPQAWQEGTRAREAVQARFDLRADGSIGFDVGAYDGARALVIDPVLTWANFLGGSQMETSYTDAMAVDPVDGSIYVAGGTYSTDFPQVGSSQTFGGPQDGFISKFSADGATLLWSTYLSGPGNEGVHDLALDADRNLIVAGFTASAVFPTTANSYQPTKVAAATDVTAFILKLDPTGTNVLYGTYAGGLGMSSFLSVAMGPNGRVYAAGWARTDFPTTVGAYDRTHPGGTIPILTLAVFDLGSNGAADLLYSTYISERSSRALDLAVDAAGDAYMTGTTSTFISTKQAPVVNFPTTANAWIKTLSIPRASSFDSSFFCKVRPGGAGAADLLYSTWIFPKQAFGEKSDGLCLAPGNIAYVAGAVHKDSGFTTTAGAYDTTFNGHRDGTLIAFDATKSGAASRLYATFIGGSAQDELHDVNLDAAGRLLVAGTSGENGGLYAVPFPTTPDAVQQTKAGGGDMVVAILDLSLSGTNQLVYSTFLGGSGGTAANGRGWEWARALLPTPDGGMAGFALFESETGFPSGISWPYDGTPAGLQDAFVYRFGP